MNFGDSKNEVDGMYLNLRGCFYYKMNSFSYNFKEHIEEHVFQNFGKLIYPYTYNINEASHIIGIYVVIDPIRNHDDPTLLVHPVIFDFSVSKIHFTSINFI